MELNYEKCRMISYTRNKDGIAFNYVLRGYDVKRVLSIADIGIIFDSQLTFNEHVKSVVAASNKTMGFIIRNTRDFDNISAIK